MLERKFANYRLHNAGITQNKAEMSCFQGPQGRKKF